MNVSLYTYTRRMLSLKDALQAFTVVVGTKRATAILYSPRRCDLANFMGGSLLGPDGNRLDIATVFEARVFNESAEFRWLNDPNPEKCHRAVILVEQDCSSKLPNWTPTDSPPVIETLPQTYLLWGEGTGQTEHQSKPLASGWSELATARIGALPIPTSDVSKNQRVLLHSREYVVEAEHGNAVIFDERLLKLEVVNG